MRSLPPILLCACLLGCAASRDDLRRAESAFDEARYEQAEVWLSDLESRVPQMDRPSRARFYYLRGIAAYRLGDRLRARHYLALCREEAQQQGVGLRREWRVNLAKVLGEFEAMPAEVSQPSNG